MIHYNAKFLRNLELEITMAYSFDKDYPQCKRLIELRCDILNEQALIFLTIHTLLSPILSFVGNLLKKLMLKVRNPIPIDLYAEKES